MARFLLPLLLGEYHHSWFLFITPNRIAFFHLCVCECVCVRKEGRNYADFQSDPRATKLFLLMQLWNRVRPKGGWVDKLDLYGYFCLMKCVVQGSTRQTERITQSLITRQGDNQYGKGFISELLIHHCWSLSQCRWQRTLITWSEQPFPVCIMVLGDRYSNH